MAYQVLENVGLLTNHKVLPPSLTAQWADETGRPVHVFLWAYRAWLVGVLSDLVRLAREAQLKTSLKARDGSALTIEETKADKQRDQKWWTDLMITTVWIPIAVHFSKRGGFPWFNMGIMGACGIGASWSRTAQLWKETENV